MHNDVWGCAEILPSRLVLFQSLSFQKAHNDLQVNVPVVKGTFVVELRDRTKLFPPGGCRETTTRKGPVSVVFDFTLSGHFVILLNPFL